MKIAAVHRRKGLRGPVELSLNRLGEVDYVYFMDGNGRRTGTVAFLSEVTLHITLEPGDAVVMEDSRK